jgi:hypothetical protein
MENIGRTGSGSGPSSARPLTQPSATVLTATSPINYQVPVAENNEFCLLLCFHLKKQLQEQNFRKERIHSLMEIHSQSPTLMRG